MSIFKSRPAEGSRSCFGTPASAETRWIQYASAGGTHWTRAYLSGSIAPGGYYLVQLHEGAQGGASLPTPDAVGGVNLHATTGKVALVSGTLALEGACPNDPNVVEIVGYGSAANCYQGAGPAPTPGTMTEGVLRDSDTCGIACDTEQDFIAATANPRNSAAPPAPCDDP